MFFELIGHSYSYDVLELAYMLAMFLAASVLSIWLHAVGHRLIQAICMGKEFDRSMKESPNPLRAFAPKNLFAIGVMFVFSFTKLNEVQAPCFSRFKNMLIAASGVATNFFWAFAAMVGYDALVIMEWYEMLPEYGTYLQSFLIAFVSTNLAIAVFNALPLPSLDGGVFFAQFLPEKTRDTFLSYRRYSLFIIAVALVLFSRSGIADGIIGGITEIFDNFIIGFARTQLGLDL